MKRVASEARTRAVGYCRVSTDQQAERGLSLEAQQAKLKAYAATYEIDMVEMIVDAGESGKSLDRQGLRRALGLLQRREADALLIVKLDRLTRSVRDLGELVAGAFAPGRAALLSVGEHIDTRSASGRMMLNLLTTIAQWEREAIGERTSAALAHKAAQGGQIGHDPPFGWAYRNGQLVERHGEQACIEHARALRSAGVSIRGIVRELADKGYTGRTGRPLAIVQVQRLLAGPKRLRPAA